MSLLSQSGSMPALVRIRRPTREKLFPDEDGDQDSQTVPENGEHFLSGSLDDFRLGADHAVDSSVFQYSSYTSPESRITLGWSHLSVHVPVLPKRNNRNSSSLFEKVSAFFRKRQNSGGMLNKPLLRNVYGIAQPGSILAIIGSSGAGKSTLMNVLMGRTPRDYVVTGKVKANGAVLGKDINKFSAYLQHDDIFHPNLTVVEHMWFHSKLRMSGERYSDKDRQEKIRSILRELGLWRCRKVLIGGETGFGAVAKKTLSGGERKRLAFATEILTNPSVFFCDEPTTGLDPYTAESIMRTMKQLAERGKTIVCTLHQPSSEIISMLDSVLVLSEGRVVYLGEARTVSDYFALIGQNCPPTFNPFDHVLEILSSSSVTFEMPPHHRHHPPRINSHQDLRLEGGQQNQAGELNDYEKSLLNLNKANIAKADALAEIFRHSNFYKTIRDEIKVTNRRHEASNGRRKTVLEQKLEAGLDPPASTWCQYRMCIWRSVKTAIRSRLTFIIRVLSTFFFAAIFSLVYANQPYNQRGAMNFVGLIYQVASLAVWENLEPYAMTIPFETPIFLREQQNSLYSPFAYYLARLVVEMPQIFVFSFIHMAIVYTSTGMYLTVGHFFAAVIIHAVAAWTGSALGSLIGYSVDHPGVSSGLRRALGPLVSLTAGMYINVSTMPAWIAWIRFIVPTFYANELMQINQWVDIDRLDCEYPPGAASCFKDGASVLEFYGFSAENVSRDVIAIIILMVAFRIGAFLVLIIRTNRNKNNA